VSAHTPIARRSCGAAQPKRLRGASSSSGQAALETMISMWVVVLFIFGLLHLCMMMVTKQVVSYAAFVAARTAMVRGTGASEVHDAAQQALEILKWYPEGNDKNVPEVEFDAARGGIVVRYHFPFGLPIWNTVSPNGLIIEGFAPVAEQPAIPEKGDNARN
jgi:TadE-like protein